MGEMGHLGWQRWQESTLTDPSKWTVDSDGSKGVFMARAVQPDDSERGCYIVVEPHFDSGSVVWSIGFYEPGEDPGITKLEASQSGEADSMVSALRHMAHNLGFIALESLAVVKP